MQKSKHLSIKRVLPNEHWADEDFIYEIHIKYNKICFFKNFAVFNDVLDHEQNRHEVISSDFIIPHSAKHTPLIIKMCIPAIARGKYNFKSLKIKFTSITGFFTYQESLHMANQMIIYPAIKIFDSQNINIRLKPLFDIESQSAFFQMDTQGEFAGVREYQAGDPSHLIHWPALLKNQNQIWVKKYQIQAPRKIKILLNPLDQKIPSLQGQASLDLALSFTVHLISYLLTSNCQVTFLRYSRFLKPQLFTNRISAIELLNKEFASITQTQALKSKFNFGTQAHRADVLITPSSHPSTQKPKECVEFTYEDMKNLLILNHLDPSITSGHKRI